jgi:hypothetical protein
MGPATPLLRLFVLPLTMEYSGHVVDSAECAGMVFPEGLLVAIEGPSILLMSPSSAFVDMRSTGTDGHTNMYIDSVYDNCKRSMSCIALMPLLSGMLCPGTGTPLSQPLTCDTRYAGKRPKLSSVLPGPEYKVASRKGITDDLNQFAPGSCMSSLSGSRIAGGPGR